MNHHPLPPIKNSTVTAGKDNIIRQDYQTQHQQINIKVGDDFSDILIPITISDTEFSVGIWMYFLPRNRPPELSGLFRDGIINMLQQHGFHKRFRDNNTYFFLQETNNQIQEVEPVNMKDFVFGQIKKFELPLKFDYRGCHVVTTQEKLRETFERQSHTIFNESFLELLPNHTKPILRDTKKSAFFFFKNTIVQVTNGEHHLIPYDQIGDVCIWKKQILNHDFEYMQRHRECHFAKFINNVSNNEPGREIAFISAIGYLLHNHIDPSRGQAVIAYDEEITDIKHPMGGTGKGLFAQAIGQMRVTTKIDGKKFDPNDRFRFQNVKDDTQVVWFDDAKPNLAFEVFHSNLTDGWMIEQKHKDQFLIAPQNSPKMLLCSNSVLPGGGITNKRRQIILEFSNHYSKQIKTGIEEPIKNEHGCLFFNRDDWDQHEWNCFFSFMIESVISYQINGLHTYQHHSVQINQLRLTTCTDFADWIIRKKLNTNEVQDTRSLFEDFRDTYFGEGSDLKQRQFTNWLHQYAKIHDLHLDIRRSNGRSYCMLKSLSL